MKKKIFRICLNDFPGKKTFVKEKFSEKLAEHFLNETCSLNQFKTVGEFLDYLNPKPKETKGALKTEEFYHHLLFMHFDYLHNERVKAYEDKKSGFLAVLINACVEFSYLQCEKTFKKQVFHHFLSQIEKKKSYQKESNPYYTFHALTKKLFSAYAVELLEEIKKEDFADFLLPSLNSEKYKRAWQNERVKRVVKHG